MVTRSAGELEAFVPVISLLEGQTRSPEGKL